jgi:hypothetical protein
LLTRSSSFSALLIYLLIPTKNLLSLLKVGMMPDLMKNASRRFVLKRLWYHQESNRGHKDFQS